MAARTATGEQFAKWWMAAKACDAIVDTITDLNDEQVERVQTEKHGYEALIGTRNAIDRQGVLIKARLLVRYLKTDGDDFGSSIVDEIIKHLGGSL